MSQRRKRKPRKQHRSDREKWSRRRPMIIGTGITLGAVLGLGPPAQAEIDTITVTTLADPGDGNCATNGCTLREAITQANDGDRVLDRIVFQSGLSGSIDLNGTQLPLIDEPLYIDGPGAETLQIDAHGASRIFETRTPMNYAQQSGLAIEGLRLSGGHADEGGAIYSRTGWLELENVEVVGNYSAGSGGGIRAIATIGSLRISGSTISGNTSHDGSGGGISSTVEPLMIQTSTPKYFPSTIAGSTISNNQAGGAGGGLSIEGPVMVARSTVSGNQGQAGGGINLSDPGVTLSFPGRVPKFTSIAKSTISSNYSQGTGGVRADVGPNYHLTVDQSTIAQNYFGGLSAERDSDVTLSGSLVGDNAAGSVTDITGLNLSAGFSLIEEAGDAVINTLAPNVIGSDPQLRPLAANGGPTETMLPASSSPAIDRGQGASSDTDQRGRRRVFDAPTIPNGAGGGADIGAVELQRSEFPRPPASPPPTPASPVAPATTSVSKKRCKRKHSRARRKKCAKRPKR
jgi:CSLREA domain-containing protein